MNHVYKEEQRNKTLRRLTKCNWAKGIDPDRCRIAQKGHGTNLNSMVFQLLSQAFHVINALEGLQGLRGWLGEP